MLNERLAKLPPLWTKQHFDLDDFGSSLESSPDKKSRDSSTALDTYLTVYRDNLATPILKQGKSFECATSIGKLNTM